MFDFGKISNSDFFTSSDLAEIRAGRMDIAGLDTTRVGMILGMVSVGIAVLSVLAQVLMLGLGAAF